LLRKKARDHHFDLAPFFCSSSRCGLLPICRQLSEQEKRNLVEYLKSLYTSGPSDSDASFEMIARRMLSQSRRKGA
jgi:hypothetical protein